MVAETRDLYILLLGGLEDREIVIDLVRFVVDEDLDLLGGEGSIQLEVTPQQRGTQQHHSIIYCKYHQFMIIQYTVKDQQTWRLTEDDC